jgi:uncharacterized LabA/DUF88 family protein
MQPAQPQRVIAYIDGFNLYFGLKSSGWDRYLWLNVRALSQNLLKSHQLLVHTKYFTSRIKGPSPKAQRQSDYLDALQTLTDFSIFFGKYQVARQTCRNCGFSYDASTEKMTDVNIAVEVLQDAFQDVFDTALLVTADSDLVGPLKAVRRLFPTKRLVVACPPNRFSQHLCAEAHSHFQIGRGTISKSVFPEEVCTASGFVLRRPPSWT